MARTQARLDAGVAELQELGLTAAGFRVDLCDPAAVGRAIAAARAALGPVTLLYWNPNGHAGSALSTPAECWSSNFHITVIGLQAAVAAVRSDLAAQRGGVLVTGGGMALERESGVRYAVDHDLAAWAVAKAAQRKLVHLLHVSLAPDGIFVGEVTVAGAVRGTRWDADGASQLTPEQVAEAAWELYRRREEWFVVLPA